MNVAMNIKLFIHLRVALNYHCKVGELLDIQALESGRSEGRFQPPVSTVTSLSLFHHCGVEITYGQARGKLRGYLLGC